MTRAPTSSVCNEAGDPINPHVVSVQETRLKVKGKLDSAYGWGDRRSVNFSLGPALSTGAGPTQSSAGVGRGVSSSLASSSVSRPPDLDEFKSRVAIIHVDVGLPGGLKVLSAYLCTSMGISGDNVEFLNALGEYLKSLTCLWFVQGDWNLTPDELGASG